jgi:molybdopterin/thiamine biosynthesis adenylyltransferase
MSATLALRTGAWQALVALLDLDVETAGFIRAGYAADDADVSLFGRNLGLVADAHYALRERDGLDIISAGVVPFLAAAERDQAVPIFVHAHPRMSARPSPRDDRVDANLYRTALIRSRAPFYASLIVGGTAKRPTFTGRLYDDQGLVAELERIRVVGDRIQLLHAEGAPDAEIDADIYDRQIRAFGADGQALLRRLRIGIVGGGGTGSATFEQLLRSGAGAITIIDSDVVTVGNVTRIHESRLADVGEAKVAVLGSAAERIGLGAEVTVVEGKITDPAVAQEMSHLDVIFGCTDDEKGRLVLSKLALTHLIPVFDMAFAVEPGDDGAIRALDGRLTILTPGEACLLCRGVITPQGLAAEDLDPAERGRRAGEGYVPGLDERDPSVGTFTTLIACYAVNELYDRLFGYSEGSPAFGASQLLVRLGDRRLSYSSRPATGVHWCAEEAMFSRGESVR